MFEAQVAYYLNQYLGKYVYGLDAQALKISVWRGDVELRNLQLKPEALQDLNLPITVKAGLLGRLTLKVPWQRLGQEPVVAEFDRLYIVAGPREDLTEAAESCKDPEQQEAAALKAEQDAKEKRVAAAEKAWIKEMEKKSDKANAAAVAGTNDGEGGGGRFAALLDTIIGNLELRISNIHIRYEDPVSNPGHTFSIGIMLSDISAHTVDEAGKRAFVTTNALATLRKGMSLQSLSIYFDCDKPLLQPGKRWSALGREDWDAMLLPGDQQPGKADHQYLLCPVDGDMTYVRRGPRARLVETDAAQEMELRLRSISVCLHQLQYSSTQKLLVSFDEYQASTPHRHLRPHCRPKSSAGARLWWRYAIRVVQRQQARQYILWRHIKAVSTMRRQYLPAYIRCLQAGRVGGDEAILHMDEDLDEHEIILFRRMAYAQYLTAKRKAAASTAAPAHSTQQQGGGWLGWLRGTGGAHKAQEHAPQQEIGSESAEMGPQEWLKLEELVAEQETQLTEVTRQTPYTVHLKFAVKVEVGAVELQGPTGATLLHGSMKGVDAMTTTYPETVDVNLDIATFGINTARGPLLSSGVLTGPPAMGATRGGGANAISVHVVRKPQDGSADLAVGLLVAPSYVTYNKAAIEDIAGFFKQQQAVELSRLQAQAAARTDKLTHMAQLQLKAMAAPNVDGTIAQKSRLILSVTMHAPKVAISDDSGGTTLIADLGLFTMETSKELASLMSAEEAALYECFTMRIDNVAAYLLDGAFQWPSAADAASGGSLMEHLGRTAQVVPVLERFGVGMDAHVSTSVHPRFPVTRLAVNASPLKLHLSPYRYQRLMTVLQSISASSAEAPGAAVEQEPGAADQPLWLSESEYSAKVSMLSWEGMTSTVAKWHQHRWVHIWRGRVYITHHKADTEPLVTKPFWRGYKAVTVPSNTVGGAENVLAIVPVAVKREAAAENADALVLRLPDAAAAAELRKRLMQSAGQMAAVAGLLKDDGADEDAEVGTTKDVFEELLSHQTLLELSGHITEVCLLISGRPPQHWWPPDDIAPGNLPSPGMGAKPQPHSMSRASSGSAMEANATATAAHPGATKDLVTLEEEEALIAMRLQGARIGMTISGDRLAVDVVMRALQIDDLLVGSKSSTKRHMARSSVIITEEEEAADAAEAGTAGGSSRNVSQDDEFFDADEGDSVTSGGTTPRGSLGSGSFLRPRRNSDALAGSGGSSGANSTAAGATDTDLVRLSFVRHNAASSQYAGVDTELALRLSELVFFCNRPTVAALMVFGTDLAAIGALLAPSQPAEGTQVDGTVGPESAAAPQTASVTETESVTDTAVVRGGGEQRTIFKMTLQVTKVELHLSYEGSCDTPLCIGSVDNFVFELGVHPATLILRASLGNMVLLYGAVPEDSPNRTMLTMREGVKGSLIEVLFRIHSAEESFHEPRVPAGMPYYSVLARLSEVQIVFMKRFLNEFLEYLAVMLAMQAKPKHVQPAAAADAATKPATTAPATAASAPPAALAAGSTAASSVEAAPASRAPSAPAQAASIPQPQPAAPSTEATPPAEQPAPRPLLVLLDVSLDAPVINLPLNSHTPGDCMEVDLGMLTVRNSVLWQMRAEAGAARQRVLLDDMAIRLTNVAGAVTANGRRGRNLLQRMGDGVAVSVRRPLSAEPGPAPPISTAVVVPELNASILDTEYKLILAILAANFAEPSELHPEVLYLHQQLLSHQAAQAPAETAAAPAAGAAPAVAQTPFDSSARLAPPVPDDSTSSDDGSDDGDDDGSDSSGSGYVGGVGTAGPRKGGKGGRQEDSMAAIQRRAATDFSTSNSALLALLGDRSSMYVTVSIHHAALELWNEQQEGAEPVALGGLECGHFWLAYTATAEGSMLLSLALPRMCIRDRRPGVPREASLVLSTSDLTGEDGGEGLINGHGSGGGSAGEAFGGSRVLPSLLGLEYRAIKSVSPHEPLQAIQLRLQRPTLVVDVGFIMAVLQFVVPTLSLQGAVPRPFETREVHLGAEPHLASDHLWLSPEFRIIADAPGVQEFVYDGQGHALVLPRGLAPTERMPLLLVGSGKTLRLRNVRVANKGALAAVLSLGAGARLVAEERDGVVMYDTDEELQLGKKYSRFMSGLQARSSRSKLPDSAAAGPATSSPSQAMGVFDIQLSAVGAALYLLDARGPSSSAASAAPGGSAAAGGVVSAGRALRHTASGHSLPDLDAAAAAVAQDVLRMLALHMDLYLHYKVQGEETLISSELRGLSIKAQTRLLKQAAAILPSPKQHATDGKSQPDAITLPLSSLAAGAQQAQCSILDPCDITASLKLTPSSQDINFDISDIRFRLSPDVAQLAMHLQQVVAQPLIVPAPDQPLARCDRFERMWTSHGGAQGPPYETAGAGGVDVMGADKGVTVWRPQAQMGYAIVGDVLTAGSAQPSFQVVSMAINSGLVAYPTGYEHVWESQGVHVWRPVAPPAHVAMGCVATTTASPPPLKQVVCVHERAVVEAALAECMLLCANGKLWCVQNNVGTFEVSPPDVHPPKVPRYDLRSPLGIAPAALQPLTQPASAAASSSTGSTSTDPSASRASASAASYTPAQLPASLLAYKNFVLARAAVLSRVASHGQQTTTVEFERLWWDKRAKHPSLTKVSFWRPVAPPGYVALGDCMVTGMYAPPQGVLVLRDADPAESLEEGPPLLARPLSYVPVWSDEHKKALGDRRFLVLWRPIAPAGYVAMGLIAAVGGTAPSLAQIRCVRSDMVCKVELRPSSPNWILMAYKQRAAVAGWVVDERTATFTVQAHDGTPQRLEAYRLKDLEELDRQQEHASAPAAPQKALHVQLKVGRTNLLLRNLLRTPILELEATEIKLGVTREATGVVRGFAFLTVSVWSFNGMLQTWEPVIEPCQLLLHLDVNAQPHPRSGVQPGSWMRLTSTQGCLHITLAHAALASVLSSLSDWHSAADQAAAAAALASTDGFTVTAQVTNTLDVPAYLQLNYGTHKDVVVLPPHATTPVRQPLPQPPLSHAALLPAVLPAVRLLVDVMEGSELSEALTSGASAAELCCCVRVVGRLAPLLQQGAGWAMATRALAVGGSSTAAATATSRPASTAGDAGAQQPEAAAAAESAPAGAALPWRERFLLSLPPALAEQLLAPAPGDNPFEGVAVELQVEVWDMAGGDGAGALVGSGKLEVAYDWLLGQVEALRHRKQQAAATVLKKRDGGKRTAALMTKAYEVDVLSSSHAESGGRSSSGGSGDKAWTTVGPNNKPLPDEPSDSGRCMQLHVNVSVDDSQVDASWNISQGGNAVPAQQMGGSQAKSHALRLEGSDMWAPFSFANQQRNGSGARPNAGVVPIKAGSGLALEISYSGGMHETSLRAPAQFVNSTDMLLEVSLFDDEDASWQVLPTARGATQQNASIGEVVEEEVFEYERYVPMLGWSPNNLMPVDPNRYSRARNGSRSSSDFPSISIPRGWEWEGPWEVESSGNVDPEGWAYAFDVTQLRYPPPPNSGSMKAHDFVRRRRLVRKRRRVELPSSVLDMAQAHAAPGEANVRRVMARLEPGGILPLPHDWHQDNKQLQLRPVLHASPAAAEPSTQARAASQQEQQEAPSHSWSYGASNGQHSVLLGNLEDGGTRLLCCKTLADEDMQDAPTAPGLRSDSASSLAVVPSSTDVTSPKRAVTRAPACWISTLAEADCLTTQQGMDTMADWRIVARPPLVLQNLLPVASHYALWERSRPGGPLALRQQGRLEGGASVNVYSLDMRQQVLLTFYPDGCEFAERQPVLVSDGFLANDAGVTSPATAPLPDTFRVNYAQSTANTSLAVRMNRQLDLELIDSQRLRAQASARSPTPSDGGAGGRGARLKLSRGAALALGRTLTLQLFVPVWIINATQLPITAGMITLAPSNAGDGGHSTLTGGSFTSVAASEQSDLSSLAQDSSVTTSGPSLRILDTEAFNTTAHPAAKVTIMPNSIDMMSFPEAPADPRQAETAAQTQWAAVVSIMGSRWCAPIVLQGAAGLPATGAGASTDDDRSREARLPRYEPVLIRARSKPDNTLLEVTARVESAGSGFQRSVVLRLDPHLIISNRTGYSLHLLQPEPLLRAVMGGGGMSGAGSFSTARTASGVSSISSVPSSSGGAWFAGQGASSPARRSVGAGTVSDLPSPASGVRTVPPPTQLEGAVMMLRGGAVGVPVHWRASATRQLLALSFPTSASVTSHSDSSSGGLVPADLADSFMWSEPFRIQHGTSCSMQVLVPVYRLGTPGEPVELTEATLAQAREHFLAACAPHGKHAGQQQDSKAAYAGPSFLHIAKHTDSGVQGYLAVVVQLAITMRTPGCIHAVLQCVGGEPQHIIQNCTDAPVLYRQAVPRAAWRQLEPLTAAGFVPIFLNTDPPASSSGMDSLDSSSTSATQVELRDANSQTSGSAIVSFERPGGSGQQHSSGTAGSMRGGGRVDQQSVFTLSGSKTDALAQVVELMEAVMLASGPQEVPGATHAGIGLTQTESVLCVVPKPPYVSASQLYTTSAVTSAEQGAMSPASSIHVALEVPALDVSLVDQRPQELLLLSVDGLTMEYHQGNSAGIGYNLMALRLNFAQLDDMLHGSGQPVVLFPMDATVLTNPSADPLASFLNVKEPSKHRGAQYAPTITGSVAALRLGVDEKLVWRLYDMVRTLTSGSAGMAGSSGAVAETQQEQQQEVASVDLPLWVDLLAFDDLPLRLSIRTDVSVRPRWAGQYTEVFNEFLNIDELPLTIRGIELEHVRAQRSYILDRVARQLQEQALGILLSVLRSYGIVGGASKFLAVSSNVFNATFMGRAASQANAPTAQRAEVSNVGHGLLEGGRALGSTLFRGFTGIVTRPLEGAEQGGLGGFVTGVGRGLVGVAAAPVGGMLAAASQVTAGIDASYTKMREQISGPGAKLSRRRLPRAVRGDRLLAPFSLQPSMGLALLHRSGAAGLAGMLSGAAAAVLGGGNRGFGHDWYEAHVTLPGGNVVVLTNARLLMLASEEFAQFEMEVLSGRRTQVDDVPPGQVKWQLSWDQMLTAELAYHRQVPGAPPDGVIIHRKFRGDDDVLVYDIRCRSSTRQAADLHSLITSTRSKYYTEPLREARGWKVTPVIAAEQQSDQEMPDVMLSMDFVRVWVVVNKPGTRALTVWRPVGPPGYASLGDVAMPGREPPARPIRMYKDVGAQRPDAPSEGPRLAAPVGFQLIYRDSGGNHPVSIWRPQPPKGYQELGDVVVPAIDEPSPTCVRCMRSDLVRQSRFYDAPVWQGTSADNMYWQCSLWQVDNAASTFVASKSNNPPTRQLAWAPVF